MLWTIEKANSFLNKIILEEGLGSLWKRISCIIIDEFHTIGDLYRGYYLESMITKILYSLENVQLESDPIQIIGMSATLPNLDEVCEWMNATIYMTDYRPVSINEFIKVRDKIYKAKDFVNGVYDQPVQGLEKEFPKIVNDRRDRLKILPLILQTVLNKANDEGLAQLDRQAGATGSVLVFCPSKQQCEITWKNLNEIGKIINLLNWLFSVIIFNILFSKRIWNRYQHWSKEKTWW